MNDFLTFFLAYAWMNVFFLVWEFVSSWVRFCETPTTSEAFPKWYRANKRLWLTRGCYVFQTKTSHDRWYGLIYILGRNQRALRGRMISHVSMTRGFSVLFRTIDYYCWAIAGIVASLGWRKDFRENPANESGRSNQTSQPTSRSNKKSIQSSRWREKPSIYCTVWHFFFHDWPSLLASVYNRFTIQVYE